MKNELVRGRELKDLEMEDFRNVITPIYKDGVRNVESMNIPVYAHCDRYWNVCLPYIDKMGESLDYKDIDMKQIIITETFRTRFFTIMKTNVEALFASYSNMLVNDKRLLALNTEINKIDYYPAATFSRNLNETLEDRNSKNEFIKELVYYFRPANLLAIYSEKRSVTELNNFDTYRKGFEITTYFTNDRSIVVDLTNLFSTYLMSNVLQSINLVINEKEIYDILSSYITRLGGDLFDILSMIFITMYETAQQYLEYTAYLCYIVDNKELIKEMDEEYLKDKAESNQERNNIADESISILNSIINAATAKLEALKNNK